ncbi:hypothetical protein M0811_00307 [Anaeramoeba ignava]|uniref:Uncharacterized protein n=1 Tax=Anaeramoeba ignava TaxID=1746090 RepID=A0A9Q0LQ91_ANAIG|nr:hypothetical protein M0811_00307 [Anaeramoeba ignava]
MSQNQLKESIEKIKKIISNSFYYISGGTSSVLSDKITCKLLGMKTENIPFVFFKYGLIDIFNENWKHYWRNKIHVTQKDAWKLGILVGACMGISKAAVNAFCINFKKSDCVDDFNSSQSDNQQNAIKLNQNLEKIPNLRILENTKKQIDFKKILLDFSSQTFSEVLYVSTMQSLFQANTYWLSKHIPQKNPPIFYRSFIALFKGGLSAFESTLITYPCDLFIRSLFSKKKLEKREIIQKTWFVAKLRASRAAWKVMFFSQSKQIILPKILKLLN